jgi:ABC-2 type transport system ATP-binding protein
MADTAISIHKLSKQYGRRKEFALRELSLKVNAGEVYGFLGPNGAGKSTTIRTLLNFIQPSSGSALVSGLDIVRDSVAIKSKVGYLSGEISLYRKLTGAQFLDYMSELQPLKHAGSRQALVKRFEAELHKPLDTLSKGNRQKIGLIQAFMHEPEVLILDEPTSGLDPLMQEAFFSLVREVQAAGTAVFVSSHNFSEVLRMCDRVGFIRAGQLVAEESIADLQAKAAHSFVITFAKKVPLVELRKLKGATVTLRDDQHVHIQMNGKLAPLFAVLAREEVVRFDPEDVNLEQEFLHFYEKEPA